MEKKARYEGKRIDTISFDMKEVILALEKTYHIDRKATARIVILEQGDVPKPLHDTHKRIALQYTYELEPNCYAKAVVDDPVESKKNDLVTCPCCNVKFTP